MSDLEVQGLVKRFGNNLVVDRVSFHVNDGEFFVLLGPSGGGKTTILRMICGLEMPDDGRIVLNGQDVTKLNPTPAQPWHGFSGLWSLSINGCLWEYCLWAGGSPCAKSGDTEIGATGCGKIGTDTTSTPQH